MPDVEFLTRAQTQDELAGFSRQVPSYRAAPLVNPGAVVVAHLGMEIPKAIRIEAVEETADTVYVGLDGAPRTPETPASVDESEGKDGPLALQRMGGRSRVDRADGNHPPKEEDLMSETLSRGEIQDRLAGRARKDPAFRAALLKDPKAVVQGHLDVKIPETIRIKAVEETADTVYVIVPYVPQPGTDLDDASLERVAGGGGKITKRQLDKLFGGAFPPDPERADHKPD